MNSSPTPPPSSSPQPYAVPPGWERFQPPRMAEPVLQVVPMAEPVVLPPSPPVRRAPLIRRLWQQIGGGSLMLSLFIHAALLAAAGLILLSTTKPVHNSDFIPGGRSKAGEEASKALNERVSIKTTTALARRTAQNQTRIVVDGPSTFNLPNAEADPLPGGADGQFCLAGGSKLGSSGSLGAGWNGGGPRTWLAQAPGFFANRCSTRQRLEKLRENGGTPACEAAVSRSLEWLKSQQNPDGSWGRTNRAAMTGLALLCFLGRCETPESPFYGENVRNGLLWLIELSRSNSHGLLSQQPKSSAATYEHGIATYALGEMYSFYRLGNSPLPGLRDAFEGGVRLIIAHQNERGAWTYGGSEHAYDKTSRGEDLSVTGWQFQALKAARHASLRIEGLDRAITRCTDYLVSMQSRDGGFGKTNRDAHYNQWSLTGCGVLGLQTLATQRTTAVKKGLRFLRDFLTAEPLDWDRNCNLYCWYYYTQAFFQAGGDDWRFYNAQFLPQILAAQQTDGSFRRGRPNWPAGDAADVLYRQCLCTLQLEVYYRYLKVADRESGSIMER